MARSVRRAIPFLFVAALAPAAARGNGRYPAASNLAFAPGGASAPSGHPLLMALQTTFGVVSTSDGGAHWQLTCEPAVGFSTEWDAALALAANGAAISGLPDGLVVAAPAYCDFQRPATSPHGPVLDLTVDLRGRRVVAAGASSGFAISDDDGATWRAGWSSAQFLVATVDVAPGHPDRVYASGYLGTQAALLRSDDGGASFTPTTRDFLGGLGPFIAGVDATNPDVLYLRIDLPTGGTMLARSDDGGATLHELVRTHNPMTGVALAADGRALWVGSSGVSAEDGIFHSADGGATWRRVSGAVTPLCLRHRAGILYVCADNVRDGFALGFSTDDGASFRPLMSWKDLAGPEACPASSPGNYLCSADWPRLRGTLVPTATDAGASDAAPVDAALVVDASVPDVQMDQDAPAPTSGGGAGCGCSLYGQREASVVPLLLLVATTVVAKRNWRQRR